MKTYFDQALSLYREHWQKVLILALLAHIPTFVSEVLNQAGMLQAFSFQNVLIAVVTIFCAVVAGLGLISMVKYPEDSLPQILRHSFKKLGAYVLTVLVLMLITMLLVGVPIVLFSALSTYFTLADLSFALVTVTILQFVFSLGLLVFGIYYFFRLSFIIHVVVFTDQKMRAAIDYALAITKKKFWMIFKALLLVLMVFVAISFIPYGFILLVPLSPLVNIFMTYMYRDIEAQYLAQQNLSDTQKALAD